MEKKEHLIKFLEWFDNNITGDEKGEAQIFLDRLFQAFGHQGIMESGGKIEFRVKKRKNTGFADLVWGPVVLIEMKKRGENLSKHYDQALDYWLNLAPLRPQYTILCNFDEFWIYDFNKQLYEPLDKVSIKDLVDHWGPLAFLYPDQNKEIPVFKNDLIEVTEKASLNVAAMYKSLIRRGIDAKEAQLFSLQCVLSMFAERIELLPKYIFTRLINECVEKEASSYDLLGDLFARMNEKNIVPHGRYKGVAYFNGGLFRKVVHIELQKEELKFLAEACKEDWSKVKPAIFGVLFEYSMDHELRHIQGAHFTSEVDIMKIVKPVIVDYWEEKVKKANVIKELELLLEELREYKVLDPACGSGNFLYVAYMELKKIEALIYSKIDQISTKKIKLMRISFISPTQFFGMDINEFAVELAKVTLMIAKKLANDQNNYDEEVLPLDNLDNNILCKDALFTPWEKVDAIIGNPPYQSKNKMNQEFGLNYINRLREKYSYIPGHADYCVYWFRLAHDNLKEKGRGGLVGTNTIRQNYSRIGGLDYIVNNNGVIFDAISNQNWSGDAGVHVSIVSWIKGEYLGNKRLSSEDNGRWSVHENIDYISSSLSVEFDVSNAKELNVNKENRCFQGITHGHDAFLLSPLESEKIILDSPIEEEVIFPMLIANDLLGRTDKKASRYSINFYSLSIIESQKYKNSFNRIKLNVLPDREKKAMEENTKNNELLALRPTARTNWHHRNFLNSWWQFSYSRGEMLSSIRNLERYIVCSRVTKRPIFDFVDSSILPNDSLMVFPFEDDYSFGILQSSYHWEWFINKCSTLREDKRYTAKSVYDTFPWPQSPTQEDIENVKKAARNLCKYRNEMIFDKDITLREMYRSLELPGKNKLKDLHQKLDKSVKIAYGFTSNEILQDLYLLNIEVARRETEKIHVNGPGLPTNL